MNTGQHGTAISYDSSINTTIITRRIFNFDQNFTKIHGRHEFQFGVRIRYEKLVETLEDVQIQQGQFSLNNEGNTGLYDPTSGSSYSQVPLHGTRGGQLLHLGSERIRPSSTAVVPAPEQREIGVFPGQFQGQLTADLEPRGPISIQRPV